MNIRREIRRAAARLAQSPGLPFWAMLAMSIGLAGAIAIVRVVDVALFAPLALQQAEHVFGLLEQRADGERHAVISPDEYELLISEEGPFEATAVMLTADVTLTSPGDPEPIRASRVSTSFFEVFEVLPIAGRVLTGADAAGQFGEVAVVSEAFWRRHFGQRPLTGQQITLDGQPVSIVGVLPRNFAYPRGAMVWQPVSQLQLASTRLHYLNVVAKRSPSTSDDALTSYMDVLNRRLIAASGPRDAHALQLRPLREVLAGRTRQTLQLLAAAVGIVLVLTGCSAANLVFARAWARRREYSLKSALGASRAHMLSEPLWESLLLAFGAVMLAAPLAFVGLHAFRVAAGEAFPELADAVPDGRSIAFAGVMAALMAFGSAILPALAILRCTGAPGGAATFRSVPRQSLPQALMAVQVALALVLATGAGLFAKGLYEASHVSTGMATSEIVVSRVTLPPRYRGAAIPEFYRSMFDRIRSLPQVRDVSATLVLPFTGAVGERSVLRPGRHASDALRASYDLVAPSYFSTMGIPILSGRPFTETEARAGAPVLAINTRLARALFGSAAGAIGRQVVFGDAFGSTASTIVAVVGDVKTTRTSSGLDLQSYGASLRSPRMAILVRLRGAPEPGDLHELRIVARAADPEIPIEFRPMAGLLFDEISLPALQTGLLIAFAVQAVLVAAVTIVGLIRWRVGQRSAELALRVALGATPAMLRRLLLRTELAWIVGGILIGLGCTVLVMPLATSMPMTVDPIDPVILVTSAMLLVTIGVAAVLPRAGRITDSADRVLRQLGEA